MPASEQYAEINVQPGYQLMCGKKALEYVRYRHTDTDLVRAARQQDFLSAARQRVPIEDLVLDGANELIDIFTEYTTSDISDSETMLEVLKLFIASRNAEINEVHFPAELGPELRLRDSPEAIDEAVDQFLGIEASGGPRGSLEDEPRTSSSGKKKGKKGSRSKKEKPTRRRPKPPGQRRTRRRRRSRRNRGEDRRPQGRRRLPRLLPDPAARRAPPTSKATPT